MGNKVSLEDHLVNLRLTSKQMVRASKKAEGSEKEAKNKLKKAIEAHNAEGARIYAQVSLRLELRSVFRGCGRLSVHGLDLGPWGPSSVPPRLLVPWRISTHHAWLLPGRLTV